MTARTAIYQFVLSRREKAKQRRIVAHGIGWAMQSDRPAIDDIGGLRHPECQLDMLLDEHDAHLARQFDQPLGNLLDDN